MQTSGSCQAVVRQSSGICQAVISLTSKCHRFVKIVISRAAYRTESLISLVSFDCDLRYENILLYILFVGNKCVFYFLSFHKRVYYEMLNIM
jgi:hypothetical protein